MEPGRERTTVLGNLAERAARIDLIIIRAKELSDELVSAVNQLNSVVATEEKKDEN